MRLPLELVMMVIVYVQDFKKDKFFEPEKFMDDDDVDNYTLLLNVYTLAILFAPKLLAIIVLSLTNIYKNRRESIVSNISLVAVTRKHRSSLFSSR